MEADAVRYLDWDSAFFGFPIAQMRVGRLDRAVLDRANEWCRAQDIRCLYFIADADDPSTTELAERNGFDLVDVRLTLACQIGSNRSMPPRVREWCDSDLPALAAIARISHRDTRFYFDRQFPNDRCDDLYETWIRNSCAGFADAVFVADAGQPAGYITCHLDPDSEGRIGLVAVGPSFQGQGLGSAMVHAALHWFAIKGVSRVTVVTQGRNTAAQTLYEKCGFRLASRQMYYHRWFLSTERDESEDGSSGLLRASGDRE